MSDRADTALDEIQKVEEIPVEVLGFISIFVLMLTLAIVAACLSAYRKGNEENKIESEISSPPPAKRQKSLSDMERARQVVIEVENECTDPYEADSEKADVESRGGSSSRSFKLTTMSTARHLNEEDVKPNKGKKLCFDDVVQKDCESGLSDLNANHFFSSKEIATMSTLSPGTLRQSA